VISQLVDKGCFDSVAVANHFDDILYQVALVFKLIVEYGFRHFFYGDVWLVLFYFGFEANYFASSVIIGSAVFAFIYYQSEKTHTFQLLYEVVPITP
jgi:hypothetical protein